MRSRISTLHDTIELRTRRLIIRPLKPSDYQAWYTANAELLPKQSRFDFGRRPVEQTTRAAFRKLVKSIRMLWLTDRFYMMNVFEKKTGRLVGMVNVIPHVRNIMQTTGVGVVINNNHWRKGYATEALRRVIEFAFTSLKFHRVTAEVETDNTPSLRAVEKLGFRKESLARGLVFAETEWRDAFVFALTAEEWGIRGTKPRVRTAFYEA